MVSTNQICNTWGVCGSSTIISGQKRMLEKGATFHPFILLFPTKIKLQIWEVRTLHHLCRKSTKSVRPSHTKVFHEPTILKKCKHLDHLDLVMRSELRTISLDNRQSDVRIWAKWAGHPFERACCTTSIMARMMRMYLMKQNYKDML